MLIPDEASITVMYLSRCKGRRESGVVGWSDLETELSRPAEMSGLIFVTWQCSSDELAGWKWGTFPALEANSMNA